MQYNSLRLRIQLRNDLDESIILNMIKFILNI